VVTATRASFSQSPHADDDGDQDVHGAAGAAAHLHRLGPSLRESRRTEMVVYRATPPDVRLRVRVGDV